MSNKSLRYTLLSDGSSDEALLPILSWVLETHLPEFAIQSTWADLRGLRRPPSELHTKIMRSIYLYPCEILFIHRDAENESLETRVNEILKALEMAKQESATIPPVICVIPVRMQETWLLIEVQAIREAAGNRNGRQPIELPRLSRLEELPDPKEMLYRLLREASELRGRRLDRFNERECARRVAEFIIDFSVLRRLYAFRQLEEKILQTILSQGWKQE